MKRCFVDERGVRCLVTDPSQPRAAHYPTPLRDYVVGNPNAWNPANGWPLSRRHDKLLDPYAR
jgi:hypothetical protein